jgi:hypothetical protein
VATKTCIKCGGTWPISFFYVHRKGKKRARCIGCDPRSNPGDYTLHRKAHNSISRHARSFGLAKADFIAKFAWNPQRMAQDLAHALTGKCPYCFEPVIDPQRLTFDVIDPTKPPHYSANVRICCGSCNTAKKLMTPEAWAERLRTWAEYRVWMETLRDNPLKNLPLFS